MNFAKNVLLRRGCVSNSQHAYVLGNVLYPCLVQLINRSRLDWNSSLSIYNWPVNKSSDIKVERCSITLIALDCLGHLRSILWAVRALATRMLSIVRIFIFEWLLFLPELGVFPDKTSVDLADQLICEIKKQRSWDDKFVRLVNT